MSSSFFTCNVSPASFLLELIQNPQMIVSVEWFLSLTALHIKITWHFLKNTNTGPHFRPNNQKLCGWKSWFFSKCFWWFKYAARLENHWSIVLKAKTNLYGIIHTIYQPSPIDGCISGFEFFLLYAMLQLTLFYIHLCLFVLRVNS